jgi:tripartite-type tricarboxylate transporter receptor subunit TctC
MMKFQRRRFLRLAAGAAALPAVSRVARAQVYPSRPVRWILGYAPGGTTDILSRLVGAWLSERLGQQFIIETRPGAGTNIGTEAVVNSAPDGYTLLMVSSSNAINATLYEKLNFNFSRDIWPVAGIARVPLVMEIHPALPAKNVTEFIAYAKANPGKISMASSGVGTPPHIGGEFFKMRAGVDMVHVPYRGSGPAVIDLIGGQVQVMFDTTVASIEQLKAGKLRPLAVTSAAPLDALPGVPVMGDYLPGFEASAWYGIGVPKNTPAEIIEKLNREVNAGLALPRLKGRIEDMGATVLPGSPADFGKLIADETEKWGKVVKASGAKPG